MKTSFDISEGVSIRYGKSKENIKGLNSLSSEMNNFNKSTFLLDENNMPRMNPKERQVANKIYDVLKWS